LRAPSSESSSAPPTRHSLAAHCEACGRGQALPPPEPPPGARRVWCQACWRCAQRRKRAWPDTCERGCPCKCDGRSWPASASAVDGTCTPPRSPTLCCEPLEAAAAAAAAAAPATAAPAVQAGLTAVSLCLNQKTAVSCVWVHSCEGCLAHGIGSGELVCSRRVARPHAFLSSTGSIPSRPAAERAEGSWGARSCLDVQGDVGAAKAFRRGSQQPSGAPRGDSSRC
jgi:hypothetical protein